MALTRSLVQRTALTGAVAVLAWGTAVTAASAAAPQRSQADDGTVIYRVQTPDTTPRTPGPIVPGLSPRTPAQVSQAKGPPSQAVLAEPVALRERPQASLRPGLHVPAGTPVQAFRHVYNRDGHWRFIQVGDATGWVPLETVQQGQL